MRCPFCSSLDTKVTDSRDTDDGASIRRRRQCLSCNRRFTTYETVEQAPLRVVKKNGSREMFDRNKLRNGLVRACEKRNISSRQIEEIVNSVERTVRNELNRRFLLKLSVILSWKNCVNWIRLPMSALRRYIGSLKI